MANPLFRTARWTLLVSLALTCTAVVTHPELIRQELFVAKGLEAGPLRNTLIAASKPPDASAGGPAEDVVVSRNALRRQPESRPVTLAAPPSQRPGRIAGNRLPNSGVTLSPPEPQKDTAVTHRTGSVRTTAPRRGGPRLSVAMPQATVQNTPPTRMTTPEASPSPSQRPRVDAQFVPHVTARPPSADHSGRNASPEPPRSAEIEARLVHLQTKLDRMADSQQQQQMERLERTTYQLAQLQQAGQLERLQQQLQRVWQDQSAAGTTQPPQPQSNVQSRDVPPEPAKAEDSSPPLLHAHPSSRDGDRYTLTIQNAEISQVLEMLGKLSGTNILTGKGVTGTVSANLVDVTVDEALAAVLHTHGFVFEHTNRFIYIMTRADAEARKQQARRIVTKVFRPHYVAVKELQTLVTPLLTPEVGKVAMTNPNEVGISSDPENTGGDAMAQGDALLVQDYSDVVAEIDALLSELDQPPMQVVIESMLLSVKLDDNMQFGVNFALLNNNNNNLVVSGNGQALNNSAGFPGVTEQIVPPLTEFLANTAGLKYGFIQGDMSMFVRALESISDTSLIASPQLRVLNKQKAELHIGEKLAYSTTTQNGTSSTQNISFLDVGTKLIIRPFASPDGMVRMEVHPEQSTGTFNAQTGLPDTSTTEVTTNVMVRDGTTVVIGGLIEEQVFESQERVPLLGAIPVVGNAFRNKTERIERKELIVLITPRIVREAESVAEADAAMYENAERMDHFRRNLSHVNRRNLTRIHYERALDYYKEGELNRAERHIELALKHSKNDMDSLRLRNLIWEALDIRRERWLPGPLRSSPDSDLHPETGVLPITGDAPPGYHRISDVQ